MEYGVVIGLEVHVQIKTNSKMFCSCANRYGDEPNTNTCPICQAMPGVLPVMNKEAIKQMIVAGLMTDCTIAPFSKFDRKNYYYPDMPKNYQITQFDLPICSNGGVPISGKGLSGNPLPDKIIGLERIHQEEDVGKSTHFSTYSIVDYNRAGIPLMETVSMPDMRSADEAHAYLTELQKIMRYAGVSDCDQEKGQMRCDVNISMRPVGQKEFGTKVEIKNLNSSRHVHNSIDYEMQRQVEVLENGGVIHQETRRWDVENQQTVFMRTKENADDYRYFPEPDLMPVEISEEWIQSIKETLPLTPAKTREKFIETYHVTAYDAHVLAQDKDLADFFDTAASASKNPKGVANILMNLLLRDLSAAGISLADCPIKPQHISELVELTDSKVISSKIAQEVFAEMLKTGNEPKKIVEEKGLVQVSDSSAIDEFVVQALEANPAVVQQYRDGKTSVVQFLVGQVMKFSRGKANPQMAIQAIKDKLDN